MENEIKLKLKERGFSDKTLLNNRGLIGAVIEESQAEQLILSGVVNCVFVVTERDNYGEQLFIDVFEKKEQAIEFLAKDGLRESNIHEINEIELN